jgi:hypothetical protein
MSNTYFKAMSVMGCEIGGITRRSLCRHNCCDGENCVTWLEKQFAKLNEYEEAKADGRMVGLPCKVGRLLQYDLALKQAREALHIIFKKHTDIKNHDKYPKTYRICAEALAEIDKVIGGKQDV